MSVYVVYFTTTNILVRSKISKQCDIEICFFFWQKAPRFGNVGIECITIAFICRKSPGNVGIKI